MAGEAVLYMRGAFPFEPGHTISSEIVANLKVLLAIDNERLTAIVRELESFSGFLDRRSVETIIQDRSLTEEHAKSLTQLILSADRLLRETKGTREQLLSRISDFAKGVENQQTPALSEEEFSQVFPRLQILVRPYAGLALQAKAQRLAEATGSRLEKLEVICDLRPIFDENRERVEGMIPFTILRVVCTGADGLPVSFEAILSEREVHELARKASAATSKLDVTRKLLAEKGLPVPVLESTTKGE